jgi:hypothetical protein
MASDFLQASQITSCSCYAGYASTLPPCQAFSMIVHRPFIGCSQKQSFLISKIFPTLDNSLQACFFTEKTLLCANMHIAFVTLISHIQQSRRPAKVKVPGRKKQQPYKRNAA